MSDWATYRAGERNTTVNSTANMLNSQLPDWQSFRAGERASINVTVQGNVISDRDLTDSLRMGLLNQSASGSFTMSNRATRGD